MAPLLLATSAGWGRLIGFLLLLAVAAVLTAPPRPPHRHGRH